jgi:hypothetical protein
MPDEEMGAELQAWLDQVDERWRATGVPTYERGRLRRELDRDVEEALRAGAEPRDLMATDPDEFADQVAAAHGLRPAESPGDPLSPGSLAVTVLAGALAGVLVVWFVVWPVLVAVAPTAGDYAFVAIDYPLAAVTVLLCAAIALRWRFGFDASVRGVILPTLAGLAAGCLLGLPATLLISRALDYPTNPVLVLFEAIPMIVLAVLGVRVARWLVARRHPELATT